MSTSPLPSPLLPRLLNALHRKELDRLALEAGITKPSYYAREALMDSLLSRRSATIFALVEFVRLEIE
jgi:hypothetical protein